VFNFNKDPKDDESESDFWGTLCIGTIIIVLAASFVVVMLGGCSTSHDLKTSQCRAKIEFNCDCTKDSSVVKDIDSVTTIIK